MRRRLVLVAVLAGCFAQGGVAARLLGDDGAVRREDARAQRRTPVVDVFESNRDAVVNISCTDTVTVRDSGFDSLFEQFFDMPFRSPLGGAPRTRQFTRQSVGSGFVLHPDGYIVTNAHVVAQTADRKVTFADGREYEAQIIASDSTRDLAILKIQAEKPLPTLKLGRSNDLMIGETVIAIGNPLGYQNTVTAGVVSAVDRDLNFGRNAAAPTLSGLVQTDASINPGNSGGPLLNVLGELIGVNTAIRGDAQNIGFAIPVDQLREVLPDLLDIERRYRIIVGLTVDTLDSPRITGVQRGTPAAEAGVRVGDVLTRINGTQVREGIEFPIALIGFRAGQKIKLGLLRESQPYEVELSPRARPLPDGAALAQEKLGIEVEELTPEVAAAIGLRDATGLVIVRVEPGGPAQRIGAQPRDVLVAVGRHAVGNKNDLGQLLELARAGETVPLTILRVDRRMNMKVQMSGEVRAR